MAGLNEKARHAAQVASVNHKVWLGRAHKVRHSDRWAQVHLQAHDQGLGQCRVVQVQAVRIQCRECADRVRGQCQLVHHQAQAGRHPVRVMDQVPEVRHSDRWVHQV